MHVLVATRELQGAAEGDFSWTIEGELVALPSSECYDSERCGCGRSFSGLSSHRATTAARVEDRPDLTEAAYTQILVDAELDDIASAGIDLEEHAELRRLAQLAAEQVARIASDFRAGAILERPEGKVRIRRPVSQR